MTVPQTDNGANRTNELLRRFLAIHFVASAILACLAHALVALAPNVCAASFAGTTFGPCRATLFFYALYLIALPIAFLKLRSILPAPKFTRLNTSAGDKILRFALGWTLLPTMALTPFLFLSDPGMTVLQNQVIYRSLTTSFVGMTVLGAAMTFGAAICIWLLSVTFPFDARRQS